MKCDGTGGVLALEYAINDNNTWTSLLMQSEGETDTCGTSSNDEDFSSGW